MRNGCPSLVKLLIALIAPEKLFKSRPILMKLNRWRILFFRLEHWRTLFFKPFLGLDLLRISHILYYAKLLKAHALHLALEQSAKPFELIIVHDL